MRSLFLPFLFVATLASPAIEIVLDFSIDEQNYNWFDPASSDGLERRKAVEAAAGFLSTIIRDDDWNAVPSFNSSIPFSDLSESTLKNISGATVSGTPESDGAGYAYSFPSTNRSSLAANQIVKYAPKLQRGIIDIDIDARTITDLVDRFLLFLENHHVFHKGL